MSDSESTEYAHPHDDDSEMDAPRVAQWVDDGDLDLPGQMDTSDSGADESVRNGSKAGPSQRLRSLEHDLSTLPLGTLRNAQRSLAQARALDGTESSSEGQSGDSPSPSESEDDGPPSHPTKDVTSDRWPKPKNNPIKRSSKHAPVQVTSKRPVSRRRVVVDSELPKPRDPRFMHAAGRYDPSKFKQHYEFLSGLRSDELVTLRGHAKRARKLLANSPVHQRAEREEEVSRLERAMKKAESAVNLDNRERVELKALQSTKQVEKEKRTRGKAGWWMKQSEKKELLAKARLDAVASVGGKRAVKKALERKRKKTSQKEKKTRPFPRNAGTESPDSKKRRPMGPIDSARGPKRRKVV